MKKKMFGSFATLLFSSVLLVGCGNDAADTSTEVDETETEDVETIAEEKVVTIEVSVDGELVEGSDKELSIEEGQNLMELMEAHYDIETTDDGFMTAIEGYEQDESAGLYWMYYVNEEMPSVGAGEYIPELADEIEWKLESFE